MSYEDEGGVPQSGVFIAEAPSVSIDYTTWTERIHRLEGADALPLADPDRDGVRNIVECALDGVPDDPSVVPGLLQLIVDDQNRVVLVVPKAPGITGVSFEAQRSGAGETWTTHGLAILENSESLLVARINDPSATELLRVQLTPSQP